MIDEGVEKAFRRILREVKSSEGERADKLERELDEALDKLAMYEERDQWAWTQHRGSMKPAEDPWSALQLPVPRLQIELIELESQPGGYTHIWRYDLIYRHTLGGIIAIPLGQTRTNGALAHQEHSLEGPWRDDVHIRRDSGQLGLPGYVVVKGNRRLVEPIPYERE